MEARLRANEYKGHWGGESDASLLEHLSDEMDELREAVAGADPGASAHEAADVANLAMFLADNHRRRMDALCREALPQRPCDPS